MAQAKFKGTMSVSETLVLIKNEITKLGLTVELVGESKHNFDDYFVYMLVYEKFYLRSDNRASLSILISGNTEESIIDVISSGAGQGMLFKFSWGADKNFVNGLRIILLKYNFREI